MPTKKQMFLCSLPDNDEGYNVRGSAMGGSRTFIHKEFTGKHIGYLKWDEEKGDFVLVLNTSPSSKTEGDAAGE